MDCIRTTRSVCPVCLKPVKAELIRRADGIYMDKSCENHGDFSVIVWRDKYNLEHWRGNTPVLKDGEHTKCPHGCTECDEHMQGSCCVLIEVTGRCNLKCSYCFADNRQNEPTLDNLKTMIKKLMSGDDKPLLQFSGGEPSIRDDLPELIAYARSAGFRYTQLNSNGLRLADDGEYVKALAQSGLSFVFMQFDGVNDDVYNTLRNAPLYEKKLKAIEMCDKYNIGVTLVPTIVRGVNDNQIGDIIRLGASLSPAVRGVHFQPVSYFGRYPKNPDDNDRFTLDELLFSVTNQTGLEAANFRPSRCDHPLCGFHGSFIADAGYAFTSGSDDMKGMLRPLTRIKSDDFAQITTAKRNREYVAQRWERAPEPPCCCKGTDTSSLDGFLNMVDTYGFTITAMAFQDAMNLDIERLRRCSLHVCDENGVRPFCAKYLSPLKA